VRKTILFLGMVVQKTPSNGSTLGRIPAQHVQPTQSSTQLEWWHWGGIIFEYKKTMPPENKDVNSDHSGSTFEVRQMGLSPSDGVAKVAPFWISLLHLDLGNLNSPIANGTL